jgi:uncharacterized protein
MQESLRLHVDALFVYPIKACAGLQVARLDFLDAGQIAGDREWVVVDAQQETVWQGSHPRLALVHPRFEAGYLVLSVPGEPDVVVPTPVPSSVCEVRIWNDFAKTLETFTGLDAGHAAADLLQRVTGETLRLVRLGEQAVARVSVNPVHLVSQLSLSELNEQLLAQGAPPAEIARLRPNIVLGGVGDPSFAFLEEQIASLSWGTATQRCELDMLGKCVRCVVPDVDPVTAAVNPETSQAIATISAQRYPGAPSYFGMYARPANACSMAQGTVLEVELCF